MIIHIEIFKSDGDFSTGISKTVGKNGDDLPFAGFFSTVHPVPKSRVMVLGHILPCGEIVSEVHELLKAAGAGIA